MTLSGVASAQGYSGAWSESTPGSWQTTGGGVTISASVVEPAQGVSEFSAATMDDVAGIDPGNIYSDPSVSGAPSLRVNFEADNDDDPGTITFTFDRPVTNPVLNIGRIGSSSSILLGLFRASTSIELTLVTEGLFLQRLGGTDNTSDFSTIDNDDHFVVHELARTIRRDTNEAVVLSQEVGPNATAGGHVRIIGTFQTVTFETSWAGPTDDGLDIVDFAWDIQNVPECGDGVVQAGEACDDGDVADGDGCSAICVIEEGASCSCATGSLFVGPRGVKSARAGGPGGGDSDDKSCAPGDVVIGMNFDISDTLGRASAVEMLCATLTRGGGTIVVTETDTLRVSGTGNSDYEPATASGVAKCPDGFALTAVTVTEPADSGSTFAEPSLACSPLLVDGGSETSIPVAGAWTGDDTSVGTAACPDGTIVTGLAVVTGAGVDSIQVGCSAVQVRCTSECEVDSDSDNDGLTDDEEDALGTDSGDADSDDDGISDGDEVGGDGVYDPLTDTNPTLADTDGDGVQDGTEKGLTAADVGDDTSDDFQPDLDPSTTTDPIAADTDGDGYCDGSIQTAGCAGGAEDTNNNGRVDAGESDPNNSCDPDPEASVCDAVDQDGDGLTDLVEEELGTDPDDADSDDDGLSDFEEVGGDNVYTVGVDTDPNNADTDGDGVQDGTESGLTNADVGDDTGDSFVPDSDPGSTTSPVRADSDLDGLKDGEEDSNGNGRIDADESDPNDPCDPDNTNVVCTDGDADGDGIPDSVEDDLGTDSTSADTDNDGLTDLEEVGDDLMYDPDTDTDPTVADTDGDGVQDGTERGRTLAQVGGDTDTSAFVPDADPGSTTDPLKADTDGDGYCDGSVALSECTAGNEDVNNDGRVDTGETDPVDPCDPDVRVQACLDISPDSDNDGLTDPVEEDLNTDPNNPDSDDDGLTDFDEVGDDLDYDAGTDTDPNDDDTDNDGINDGDEVDNGTDPLDPNDPGDGSTNPTDPTNPGADDPAILFSGGGLSGCSSTNQPAPMASILLAIGACIVLRRRRREIE